MAWWAAYCANRQELLARDRLLEAGFAVFCPFERITRRMPRRGGGYNVVRRDEPLFAPYLFVGVGDAPGVLGVKGVLRLVGTAEGGPQAIADKIIDKWRLFADAAGMVRKRDVAKLSAEFKAAVGDLFIIKGTGLEGVTARLSSLARLDRDGTIGVVLPFLGGEREFDLPHTVVGRILRPGAIAPVASAA